MQSEYKLTLPAVQPDQAEPLAKSRLDEAAKNLGFVPNMYHMMANSAGLFDTYIHGYSRFREQSGFTPAEQEVVFLAISRENECSYCMAAHSFIADKMSGVPAHVTDAIRDGQPVTDVKLAALHDFTRTMVRKRGLPNAEDVNQFLTAGFTEKQILEIILAISVKTLSNYSNHLFHTSVDKLFSDRIWEV